MQAHEISEYDYKIELGIALRFLCIKELGLTSCCVPLSRPVVDGIQNELHQTRKRSQNIGNLAPNQNN